MKNLGITHVVSVKPDPTLANLTAAKNIKVITLEPGVQISSSSPSVLERFADQGYFSDFEVEINQTVANVGYIFSRRDTVSTPFTENGANGLKSFVANHQSGYMFTGPPQPSNYPPPQCPPPDSSSRMFSPKWAGNIWCRADFVMSVGDKNGSPDSVVAKIVVANLNGWLRWCQSLGYYGWSTDYCHCDSVYSLPPIQVMKYNFVTPLGDTVKVDTLIYDSLGRLDTTQIWAWMRDVKVSDFSTAGVLDTISLNYLQLNGSPYRFQVFWTKQKDVFVDKITISNSAGRKLDSITTKPVPGSEYYSARGYIESYYSTLQANPLFRWYLADEAWGGSIPTMNNADDLLRDVPNAGPIRLYTTMHGGWKDTRIYQDFFNTVSPPEFATEFSAHYCDVDSTSSSQDTIVGSGGIKTVSRQKNFSDNIAVMRDLYNRATVQFSKPLWVTFYPSELWGPNDTNQCPSKPLRKEFRRPTEAELNAQVLLALAYGARGIAYWEYISRYNLGGPNCGGGNSASQAAQYTEPDREIVGTDPSKGIFTPSILKPSVACPPCSTYNDLSEFGGFRTRSLVEWNGTTWAPNEKWSWVKGVNDKVKKIGPTLLNLTWLNAGSIQNAAAVTGG
ncbi:MAG: hypothetical protein L0Y74_04015, partial [candidate division Zixibacteria bacterium]|nr:hypothetical protein [candidate division Zixibacteria bacterium]